MPVSAAVLCVMAAIVLWHEQGPHRYIANCIAHHEPTFFCLLMVKSKPTDPGDLKFKAKKKKNTICCLKKDLKTIQSLQMQKQLHIC